MASLAETTRTAGAGRDRTRFLASHTHSHLDARKAAPCASVAPQNGMVIATVPSGLTQIRMCLALRRVTTTGIPSITFSPVCSFILPSSARPNGWWAVSRAYCASSSMGGPLWLRGGVVWGDCYHPHSQRLQRMATTRSSTWRSPYVETESVNITSRGLRASRRNVSAQSPWFHQTARGILPPLKES